MFDHFIVGAGFAGSVLAERLGSGPPHTSLLDPELPVKLARYAGAVAARYPFIDAYTPIAEPCPPDLLGINTRQSRLVAAARATYLLTRSAVCAGA